MSNTEKSVYFYKISPSPTFTINIDNDANALYQMFKNVFHNTELVHSYTAKDGNTFYIEIIELTKDFVFGTYSKKEPNPNQKIRIRESTDSNDDSCLPNAHNFPEKDNLEYYTFFYVDFNKLLMAYISNKQSGKLSKIIQEYFYLHNMNISIVDYDVSDTDKIIKSFKSISQLDLCYSDKLAESQSKFIFEIHDDDQAKIGTYHIEIKFKEKSGSMNHMKKILEQKNDYSKISIKGETESNILQSFDYIKRSFMIHETITMSNNPSNDKNNIKKALKSAIEKVYNQKY